MVECGHAGERRGCSDDRRAEERGERDARAPRPERGGDREERGRRRDDEISARRAEPELQPLDREQERRVVVGAGLRPGRQRYPHREEQQPGREQGLNARQRPAPRRLHAERGACEREHIEEVSLLHERAVAPDGRLEQQRRAERGREPAERRLGARARPNDAEPDAERRARHDRPAGAVEQHRQVLADRADVEVEVARARVVAEAAQGHADECAEDGECGGSERETLLARQAAQLVLAQPDRDDGEREAERQDRQLQPRERRERRAREEEPLRAKPRPLERGDPCGDCGERKRISDRLRQHEARVEGVGNEERARGDGECRLAAGADAARNRVGGNCGERERGGVHDLHEAVRRLDAADVPDRSSEQRFEQRREVRGSAADGRAVEAAERPAERRVQVLVREVVRGRVQPGERDPDGERRRRARRRRAARGSGGGDEAGPSQEASTVRQTALTPCATRRRRRSRDT